MIEPGVKVMSRQLFDLTGRVALVTGGSKGLGKAMARGFAQAGADVVISSRHEEELVAAEADIQADTAVRVAHFVADMTQRENVRRLAERALAAMGRVNILVNNAGSNQPQPTERIVNEDWDRLVELNLNSCMALTRALVGPMKERQWGRIINVSSILGLTSAAGRSAYSATKSGLIGLTRAGANDLGSFGITVNCLAHRAVLDRPSSQPVDGRAADGLRPENDPRSLGEAGGTCGAGLAPGKRGGELHHRRHAGGGWRLPGEDVLIEVPIPRPEPLRIPAHGPPDRRIIIPRMIVVDPGRRVVFHPRKTETCPHQAAVRSLSP